MHVTRQFWAVVALATAFAAGGVALARPVLVVGAAMIGAWLIARQYAFARALGETMAALSIDQTLARDRVVAERPTPLAFRATLTQQTPLGIALEPGIPVGASVEGESELTLGPDERVSERVVDISWPIAGTFEFDPATISARDPLGLFEETLMGGATPTVTVEPRGPRNVHVGKGGERIRRAFGEHESDPLESGMDPEEIREYMPGDAARIIDWKSTARMGYPHVREFESETDRKTVLLMDHRSSMGDGPEDETKLDYARHVALSLAEQVQGSTDPLGFYAVDGEGVTERLPPRNSTGHYAAVRSRIHDLAVTPGDAPVRTDRDQWSTARTRELANLDESSPFSTRLRPYGGSMTMNETQAVEDDPLAAAVRTHIRRLGSGTWTIILTDDTHRAEVREAALLARHQGRRVLVMLTPTVMFESDELADLSAAYEGYSEFEAFRRSLDRLDRVSALEIAPSDRLAAVRSSGRQARRAVA
ncbi:DUF58 domain-containing protein [Halalkalicoccus subterraneus]|uniref:DUF58 domain-containing protein n=1 Tax=Halalkalicoccus subterraneus TaxID=2675002 RepID=UPI000EFB76D2|nr:DUF58 domain-containing protein [Halalkalicoccus subterraneus]